MGVRNLINDKGNPAANQFVIRTANATYFQSYHSVVAKIGDKGLVLSEDWDYSNTTRKHLYIFLRDYYGNGYNYRKDVLKGIKEGDITLVNRSSLDIV